MPPKNVRVYGIGDRVFAKIKGYPPWPARIEETYPPGYKQTPGRYPVFFFGTYETAVVAAKDIFPYEQYKHQYGIERKKMKNFNEGLVEIEKTPNMSSDTEDLVKLREERANSANPEAESDSESDCSFQKSDVDDFSELDSLESPSSDENKKSKKRNGKPKGNSSQSSKKSKRANSIDQSESDSDSSVQKGKTKVKLKSSSSKKLPSNSDIDEKPARNSKGKSKNQVKKRKNNHTRSGSEVSKSSVDSDDDEEVRRILPNKARKSNLSDSENEGSSKLSTKSSSKSNQSDISDLEESRKGKLKKRSRIELNSDSDSKSSETKKSKNTDSSKDVSRLKKKLEEKEREKERRKKEKMEQKRLERIKKTQEGDGNGAEKCTITLGDNLATINQNIKLSLSITNANVDKCLAAMDSITDLKIGTQSIASYSVQLKELIQTLKKCKKYKSDQRVRQKAQLCLTKFKENFLTNEDADAKCGSENVPIAPEDCVSEPVVVNEQPNEVHAEVVSAENISKHGSTSQSEESKESSNDSLN